jgi:methylenetetrahydrofolate reductase (NADPH)
MSQTSPPTRVPRFEPWYKPTLRQRLSQAGAFVTCVELVTSRGIITERNSRRVLELARRLAEHPRIDALSITDNPGGNAMLGADTLGTDLIARGQEVIIHLSCKDWNRNALQSRGWELASGGFENVLCLSGDCPTSGYEGQAPGVFDIDSVALLKMFTDMNAGLEMPLRNGGRSKPMQHTSFLKGAVVNNFKLRENEVMPQYFKLAKKIDTGADFVINQLGYDARKQDELIKYMRHKGLDVPVLYNVYVLSGPASRFFNSVKIPGCLVTDELLEVCQKHAQSVDKGKAFFLEFAAKQVAIGKGLGYRGAYIGGHIQFDDYMRILDLAESFGEDDWVQFAKEIRYDRDNEFHYFEIDPDTGLSSDVINQRYLASKTLSGQKRQRGFVPLTYKMNRVVHDRVFKRDSAGYNVGRRVYDKLDGASAKVRRIAHKLEHAVKMVGFDCRDCGDCSLPDIAYLCPESQCAKNQRNGPCGGTRDGMCEVGEKVCIWAHAYDRLKAYGEEEQMLDGQVIIKDAALQGTSAWANTFLERDHHAGNEEKFEDSNAQ